MTIPSSASFQFAVCNGCITISMIIYFRAIIPDSQWRCVSAKIKVSFMTSSGNSHNRTMMTLSVFGAVDPLTLTVRTRKTDQGDLTRSRILLAARDYLPVIICHRCSGLTLRAVRINCIKKNSLKLSRWKLLYLHLRRHLCVAPTRNHRVPGECRMLIGWCEYAWL